MTGHGRRIRSGGAIAATLIAMATLPAVARAAEVSVVKNYLSPSTFGLPSSGIIYEAGGGEANALTLDADGDTITLTDAGASIDPGRGCRGGGEAGTSARCRVPRKPALEGVPAGLGLGLAGATIVPRFGDGEDVLDATAVPRRLEHRRGGRFTMYVHAFGGDGADELVTGSTEDEIDSGAGDDLVSSGPGNDRLISGRMPDGADYLDAGTGRDAADYSRRRDPVAVTYGGSRDDGAAGEGDTVIGVTEVRGGHADDLVIGGDGDDIVDGGGGDDVLTGLGGDDFLLGDDLIKRGAGNDVLDGGDGEDLLIGDLGRDVLDAGDGDDYVDGVVAALIVGLDRGRDEIACGSGNDKGRAESRDELSGCERVRRQDNAPPGFDDFD